MRAYRIATVLAVMAATGSAMAATITQTKTFGPAAAGSQGQVTFNKFDSSLGTLNSIHVTAVLNTSGGSFAVDNDSNQPASGDLSVGASLAISSTDVALLNNSFQPVISPISAQTTAPGIELSADDGDTANQYDAGGTDWAIVNGSSQNASGDGYIGASLFGGYQSIGGGTYVINYDSDLITEWTGVGGINGVFTSASVDGAIEVVYDYSPVPEPALIGLAASAVPALLIRRRKRA